MDKNSKNISGILVVADSREQETADLICETTAKALQLIHESWGWGTPEDCRIHVMTSWASFFFLSAPWPWRLLLALTFPLWSFRARRTWPYAAAWTQRFGKRVVIGIKPPRLMDVSDKSAGEFMFVEEKDPQTKVRHVTCHELTHACSAYLGLPAWLNEGLAAVTVDRYLGKQTIHADTQELVGSFTPKEKPPTYREMSTLRGKALAYHAVRGYWLVRYLEENHPGFLKQHLVSPQAVAGIEANIAALLGVALEDFWGKIDDLIGSLPGENTAPVQAD